jgi:type 1 glutamine amidotransferase
MRPACCLLLAACISLFALPGPAPSAAPKDKPVRVLFVLGSPPFHDIRTLPPILEAAMKKVGGLTVARLEPPADKKPNDPDHLPKLAQVSRKDYDVLVFYTTGYKLGELEERALQQFVEEGGGIVALHGASASFSNSKVWLRLVGGSFAGHIPGTHKLAIVIADDKHPITAGVGPFEIIDEEYKHTLPADLERHVLARFRERPPASDPQANNDILWTRQIGKGRVVYNALGHDKHAWTHPAWQKLTIQSIFWAAGRPREVKLDKP